MQGAYHIHGESRPRQPPAIWQAQVPDPIEGMRREDAIQFRGEEFRNQQRGEGDERIGHVRQGLVPDEEDRGGDRASSVERRPIGADAPPRLC